MKRTKIKNNNSNQALNLQGIAIQNVFQKVQFISKNIKKIPCIYIEYRVY